MSSNISRFAAALLLGASLLLGGCGEGTATLASKPPLPTPTPVGALTPSPGSVYLGIYSTTGVFNFEHDTLNRTFAMDTHYYTWAGLFPGFQEDQDISNARLVLDSWDCGPSNAQIASGAEDGLLITRAQAIRAFGHPVFLNYMWDMNVPDDQTVSPVQSSRTGCHDSRDEANGVFSPAEYVAAYNHIHHLFAQQHVNNVVWVWSVSATGSNPAAYYPGGGNVDWVGIDAFDTEAQPDLAPTMSAMYSEVSGYGKPILLLAGAASGLQQGYFASVVPELQTKFPMVSAYVYYDSKLGLDNWSFGADGLSEFIVMAHDPYLSGYPNL